MNNSLRFIRNHVGASLAATAAVVVLGGGSLALAQNGSGMPNDVTSPPTSTAPPATGPTAKHAAAGPGKKAVDPARQAWAHQYGLDRMTMPQLAPVAGATPEQLAAATDLLLKTEAATAKYSNIDAAKAAGFDLQASLTKHEEKKGPKLAERISRIDSGGAMPGGNMPMLHVANKANHRDGKVLDPSAPETLMYGYQGHGTWTLMGVMYTANETYPQAPPDPGGPITRWHYHDKSGGQGLMMHIFFVPGNDLAHAYASDLKG